MICPRCGHSNAAGEEICAHCGNTLWPGGSFVQERRWVSVVFFDLSRFTEYTLKHALEDAWEATHNALQAAASHARLYGGHVDKFFGDGFLAVFGVPRSQESDAQAALEAARAMVASSPLPGRAGVASGLVLRTPLGGGVAGDQTVLGPAVNLAQRLSQAAPPGEVWCDATTVRLVPRALAEPLPPQPLKGFAEPLVPFCYRGMRSEAPDLVGREKELQRLREALVEVQQGAGRRVVVHGPMGVGKSYLARCFVETLPQGVRGVVAPRLTLGVALRHALRQGLQQLLREGLVRLRQLELPEHLQTVLEYSVGLEPHPGLPASELDALLVEAWQRLLARVAQEGPVVVVLDDLHSADPTVLEFTRRPAPPGVLLLLVARQNRWGPAEDLLSLPLGPLSLEETQRLIHQIRPELPPATCLHLAEASGGYPLAVRALSVTATGEPEPIPLYQPRLDGLPRPARVALQAAAVLGPTVPPELVRHLVGEEADLTRLVGEGFLEADEQGQLRFVIPWLREAVLGQVGAGQARGWHQQAARWYQRQGRLAEAAVHLEAAGDVRAAYQAWRLVAQQAWSEGRYAGALLGYLEALRLAEGRVAWQAALEAAEAHLALGRYAEALELAARPLASPELPPTLRQWAWALRLEASLALGQAEPVEALPEEAQEPRFRLALARVRTGAEAEDLLAGLPPGLQGPALLVRARAWLREGRLAEAQRACERYLEEHARNPTECFEARQLLAEALWRQFKPQEALGALVAPHEALPAWFTALYHASRAALLLDLGQLEQAERLLEEAEPLVEGAPAWVVERLGLACLRYFLESGQLEKALRYGEAVLAQAPSPLLHGYLAVAHALAPGRRHGEMLERLLWGLEVEDAEALALAELALGLRRSYEGQDGGPHLRRAARLARKGHNPGLYYHALTVLGLHLYSRSARKALALSRYLLRQTAASGFELHHGYARLLHEHILLLEGRESGLADFEAKTPLARLWRRLLCQELRSEKLRGYGIVGIWLRWWARRLPGPRPFEGVGVEPGQALE
ncbi:adenylate/guanylate cyclase [Meiothermus sp. QL-1]|uniref:AAA family ATPase n=1 Tax=Meiothermus sp. QL-1 TaxID=2058095 RepID=UPI000E0AF5A0|nr:AAA family ATPase [Meiothermus sp. QL-1]RDI95515.1 adenylate/guanylate cyclase [Meiothermus sp. QL-1]